MVKRALTLLTSILFALPLLMPFNIYADTLPQSEIVGVTYNKIDQDVTYVNSSGTYTYIYEVEVLLKNKYVGVVDGTLSYSYAENPQSQTVTSSKRTYVNGDSFKLNVSIVQYGASYSGSSPMYSASFLVNAQNTNVTKYEDLNSIETVVSILQDIYNNSGDIENLSTNQLTELEKIVQNTSLANTYLDTISKLKQFNIPFECVPYIGYCFSKNFELAGFTTYNYWNIPLFKFNSGNEIGYAYFYSASKNWVRKFILVTNKHANYANYQNIFTVLNGRVIDAFEMGSDSFYIYVYDILPAENVSSGYITIKVNSSFTGVPLFFKASTNNSGIYDVSTDFGIVFRLNNQLLNDIHVIANGTAQSSSAASSNNLANSQLQTDSNTLFEQENGFKSDMQSAMQNVNNTFRLQDMGTKFVSSAQWVRTQYEQLTNNTPFASLITFSLITGLALILLGKVYR